MNYYAQVLIDGAKLILAVSPLLVLFYIVYSGFESSEAEAAKRKKDDDFVLEGHSE